MLPPDDSGKQPPAGRPPSEEEHFDRLAALLDTDREELSTSEEKGMRRYLKQWILEGNDPTGNATSHLLVLMTDVLIIATNATTFRTERHRFDIIFTLPLRGLSMQLFTPMMVIEHSKKELTVVVEGQPYIVVSAHKSIAEEVSLYNERERDNEYLPSSVIRPSRDPRYRPAPDREEGPTNKKVRMVEPTPREPADMKSEADDYEDEEPTTPARAIALREEARTKALHRRKDIAMNRNARRVSRTAAPSCSNRRTRNPNNGIRIVERKAVKETEAEQTEEQVPPEEQSEEVIHALLLANGEATPTYLRDFARRSTLRIFGAAAGQTILERMEPEYAGFLTMTSDDPAAAMPLEYRVLQFPEFFVVQRVGPPATEDYEVFLMHEATIETSEEGPVILRFPHQTFSINLYEQPEPWIERFEQSIEMARALEMSRLDEQRTFPRTLGNCFVHESRSSVSRRAPDMAYFNSDIEEEVKKVRRLLDLQVRLGNEILWLIAQRREVLTFSMNTVRMYGPDGTLVTRHVVILSDKMLIVTETENPVTRLHTYTLVDIIDFHKLQIGRIDNVIVLRGQSKKYLIAETEAQAIAWYTQLAVLTATDMADERKIEVPKGLESFLHEFACITERRRQKLENGEIALGEDPVLVDFPKDEKEEEPMGVDEYEDEAMNGANSDADMPDSDHEGTVHGPGEDPMDLITEHGDFDDDEEALKDVPEPEGGFEDNDGDDEGDENDEFLDDNVEWQTDLKEAEAEPKRQGDRKKGYWGKSPPDKNKKEQPVLNLNLSRRIIIDEGPEEDPSVESGYVPTRQDRGVSVPREGLILELPPIEEQEDSRDPRVNARRDREIRRHQAQQQQMALNQLVMEGFSIAPPTAEERMRMAMIASAQERMRQEDRIRARKRANGESTSRVCFEKEPEEEQPTTSSSSETVVYGPMPKPPSRPATPVRVHVLTEQEFINSLFEYDDIAPSTSAPSTVIVPLREAIPQPVAELPPAVEEMEDEDEYTSSSSSSDSSFGFELHSEDFHDDNSRTGDVTSDNNAQEDANSERAIDELIASAQQEAEEKKTE